MIGLVMAGGRGSRMRLWFRQEKLLMRYRKPIVFHVLDALLDSGCFTKVFAVTSPNSPMTRKSISEKNYEFIETSGDGYAEDLNFVLRSLEEPVLVTSADLPLLDASIVRQIVSHYDPDMLTSVMMTKKFLESLNLYPTPDVICEDGHHCYSGISMIDSSRVNSFDIMPEDFLVIDDRRIAFNVNSKHDYDLLNTA